jgi:hypothetical protein
LTASIQQYQPGLIGDIGLPKPCQDRWRYSSPSADLSRQRAESRKSEENICPAGAPDSAGSLRWLLIEGVICAVVGNLSGGWCAGRASCHYLFPSFFPCMESFTERGGRLLIYTNIIRISEFKRNHNDNLNEIEKTIRHFPGHCAIRNRLVFIPSSYPTPSSSSSQTSALAP